MTNLDLAFKVKREPPGESEETPRHAIEAILDIKKEMNVTELMNRGSSPGTSQSNATDSNITLWQFLLELLQQDHNGDIIEWTRVADGEFRLIDAEAVAKKWGQRKAKPHMNYDKLSRALRYYYEKNIIKKVIGKKFVYRFVTDPNASVEYQNLKMCYVKEEKDLPSHEIPSFLPPAPHQRSDFSTLSLLGTESPATVHSVSTPSPSDSVCSPSSSTGSSTTTIHHSVSPAPIASSQPEEQRHARKRSLSPCVSSAYTSSTYTPTTSSQKPEVKTETPPTKRGVKPNPLNLTATSNFVVPPISPLLLLQHHNSPLLAPNLGQLYAITALASAGLYGPQMSPLLAAHSPFRSPLTTPKTLGFGTGIPTSETGSSSEPQVFQFPPVNAFQSNPLMNTFNNLISPMAPFMMPSQSSSTSFKFPSSTDALKTPTVPIKMPTL